MKAQTMVDVVLISITPISNLLHHNNVEVLYLGTSNLRMEVVRSIPLYYVAMPQSMVIITKAPFIIILTHIVVSMRSKP